MNNKYASFIRLLNLLYDVAIINITLIFIFKSLNFPILHATATQAKYLFFSLLNINLTWVAAAFFADIYALRNLIYFKEGFKNSFKGLLLFFLFIAGINFFSSTALLYTRNNLLNFLLIFTLFFWLGRFIFYYLKKTYNLELYSGKRVLIIGSIDVVEEIKASFLRYKENGYVFTDYINDANFYNQPQLFTEQIIATIKQKLIDEVFFAKTQIKDEELYNLIQQLDKQAVRIKVIPDFFNFYTQLKTLSFIGNIPLLSLRAEPLESLLNRLLKRSFDIIFSILVICFVFSWLFPLLAILIKLESKGPVFFKQQRSGRDNKPFWCYKFRSMKVNDKADIEQAKKGDSRITRIGSIIRKTSIDELPQFFNVLKGNMSVVGPRPHMLKHTEQYAAMVDKYMIRHFVKPGITGWAQVHGYRGEINNVQDIEKRVEYDIWYIENWSLVLDIQIILLTIYNIIKGEKNAH